MNKVFKLIFESPSTSATKKSDKYNEYTWHKNELHPKSKTQVYCFGKKSQM